MHFQTLAIIGANFQVFIVIGQLMLLKYILYCSFFYNNSIISEVYKPIIKPLLLLFLKYVAQTELRKGKQRKVY